jgi:hypothetical protein
MHPFELLRLKGHETQNLTSGEETSLLLKERREGSEDELEDVSSYRMAILKTENNVS